MIKALYGYGGHAREVANQIGEEVVFFVDDEWVNEFTKSISSFDTNKYEMMIAISNSNDREDIVKRLPKETKYFTFIHPTAIILNDVEIGEGSFIGINSVITCNIKIGKHSILNRCNQIGHDSIIGDYFSAMPGSIVSGNVTIGNNVYIGTNSSIREKINVCNNVTIGLNTGLVKNIDSPGTYVGSPLKKIK
jgi:sugar O-acyltransferase (sialic acid O-acetyltransferase NeuD family)